jgi:uncharacterized phiE125 gp8 family phage protein
MTQHVRITRIAGASPQLPITLEEVKTHLKVEDDSEDGLVYSYMLAAVKWAEERTRRAISLSDYLIVRDHFPIGAWQLPLGKIQAITKVEYIDVDGVTQTWPSTEYETDLASDFQSRLQPKSTYSWPSTGTYLSAARVTVSAGWQPENVPYTLKQALLMKVADFYEVRAPGDPLATSLDTAADILLTGWSLPYY